MLFTILIVVYALVAISIVISLLINGIRPSKTLAWLLVIFTIPVGGVLLYILVGRNRRKKKLLRLTKNHGQKYTYPLNYKNLKISEADKKMAKLIQKATGFIPTKTNNILFLKDGKMTFTAIFQALENATQFIHMQYYIFEEGRLADKLLEVFTRKANEGIQIRLLYDGIGSFTLSKSYLKKLKTIGVEVFPFLPFRFGRFLSSVNYRNHRKIIVVDGRIAFTGGINLSDKYLRGDTTLGKWHDMHLRIEGSAAEDLNKVFLQDWQLVNGQLVYSKIRTISSADSGMTTIQIAAAGPDDDFSTIEEVYFSMINNAKEYLYIVNPYIIPSSAILTALETAALSGIDVRLLISEKSDSQLVNWSVRSYFENLLKAGVSIYLFSKGFLHSKIVISDDRVASVGTANIDIRSFEQNYEVNAILYDAACTKALKKDFLDDSTQSRKLSYETYLNRPWLDKLKEGFAKIFSPIL